MQSQKNRVIIDTNLWISFLIKNDFSKFNNLITEKKIELLFSDKLINEFLEVTKRRKFRKYFDLEDVEKLLIKIMDVALFIKVTSIATACNDEKDNFLLSLSDDGDATHLITGDKDLLVLKKYGKTKIQSIADYLSEN